MINLPRNLVYTDRTALSDFMEENELNREIGFVLEGMLRFQCGYYPASSDNLVEQNMLSIFNHAYYLCTLAAHDEQADTYFQNCDRYGARFQSVQVALVILALQAQKTELMKKMQFLASNSICLQNKKQKIMALLRMWQSHFRRRKLWQRI